ncbi:hypothetical protein RchiOBHm_Chr4g0398021 [Rosa chinensis]|uniref:Uncharacterized protein n=1 Tax=Rosa chinensis TaxID=74649 RepID=A0A2P6QS61_ROSCH|nr:hypothetical protein RchiOBHm_Chr4g0398021 [Rosa chinensis]
MKVVRNCVFSTVLENHDNPTVNSFSIKFLLRLGHVSPSTLS